MGTKNSLPMDVVDLEGLARFRQMAGTEMFEELKERLCGFDFLELRSAVDSGETETVTHKLHRLNSDSGWLCARPLNDLAAHLEIESVEGRPDQVRSQLDRLEELYQATREVLLKQPPS